jgi:hypothetical protein
MAAATNDGAHHDPSGTEAPTGTGFVTAGQRDGRWWLLDPGGAEFLSLAVNHADETDLKYPHNLPIWQERYGSRDRWISGVVADMRDWGFTTLGWTQQWVTGAHGLDFHWTDPLNLGHSIGWSVRDIQSTAMPYVLQLRVAAVEGWNGHPIFPDVFSAEFDEHCAYLAREWCASVVDDPNLIGYFFTDIPSWLPHAAGGNFVGLDGDSVGGQRRSLYEVASKYYETMTRHIRAYDPHHLILGDRYNGNMGIPADVLRAAQPFIDVLSVQYFAGNTERDFERMRSDLAGWHETTGKPVIIADIGNCAPTAMNPHRDGGLADQSARGDQYIGSFDAVIREPWFVGWHWCGYLENPARGWGLKDENDNPYLDFVKPMAQYNKQAHELHRGH